MENPDGSSQDDQRRDVEEGYVGAPDVLDLGSSFALSAAQQGLLAPYKVTAFADIPEGRRTAQGRWFNDYGGYISIGCDAKKVKECPKTFKDLLKPEYKGQVALNGNPTKSGSAFGGVYAASLANGGSFDDIQPGLDFFAKLKKNGNYTPVESTPATVEKGETPISIDWDYLNAGYADEFKSKGVDLDGHGTRGRQVLPVLLPGRQQGRPDPAAARLWQEYLYSAEGQNLCSKGYARPALMTAMQTAWTLQDRRRQAPRQLPGMPSSPTEAQQAKAKTVLAQGWGKARVSSDHHPPHRGRGRRDARRRRFPAAAAPRPRLGSPVSAARLRRDRLRHPGPGHAERRLHRQGPDDLGATSYTTANLTDSLQGAYLTALIGSVKLSAVSAGIATVLGLPLAQAVGDLPLPRPARGGPHRVRRPRQLRRCAAGLRVRRHPRQRGCPDRAPGPEGRGLGPLQLLGPGHRSPGTSPDPADGPHHHARPGGLRLPVARGRTEQRRHRIQYWRHIALPVLTPSLLGGLALLFGSAFADATAAAMVDRVPRWSPCRSPTPSPATSWSARRTWRSPSASTWSLSRAWSWPCTCPCNDGSAMAGS